MTQHLRRRNTVNGVSVTAYIKNMVRRAQGICFNENNIIEKTDYFYRPIKLNIGYIIIYVAYFNIKKFNI